MDAQPCDLPWAHVEALDDVRADGRSLQAVAEVGALAAAPGPVGARAQAAVEALRVFAPVDGVVLDRWNPARGRHEPVASIGIPAHALGGGAPSELILRDPGYRYVRARRVAHRRCDVPDAEQNPWISALRDTSGYREGVTACLFDGDRYVGMLNLGLADERPLEPWRMVLLSIALRGLSRLVDVARAPDLAAAALRPDAPATLLHADGRSEPLPGRPPSALLAPGAEALRAARRHAPRGQGSSAFLWHAEGDGLWRVVVLRLGAAGAAGTLLVTVEPFASALSVRQHEVLTLMAAGLPNGAIAARLGISAHTVARHVEHVFERLGVHGRVEAAACAVREGLVLAARDR